MGVLVSGRGSNLQAILEASSSSRIRASVEVVISDRPQAAALGLARQSGVSTVCLNPKEYPNREAFDAAVAELLQKYRVELVVLGGFLRLITAKLILPFKNRIINIHPSLLPCFPGLSAQKQALTRHVKITGCTVHFVDETMDQGPVIIQAAVPILEEDTEETLGARILEQEHRILPQAIQYFAEGRLEIKGNRVHIKSPLSQSAAFLCSPGLEIIM